MKNICILLFSLYINTCLGSYYSNQDKQKLVYGRLDSHQLVQFLAKLTKKGFRPLGYKKQSKKYLFGVIDLKKDHNGYYVFDVYCHKKVRANVGVKKIPTNEIMNTEHTWPQSKGSKREPARGDLHHLFPTDSRANSARGNYPFAEVKGRDAHRTCSASQRGQAIDPSTGRDTGIRAFSPPFRHRGNTARAMFYVSMKYGHKLSAIEEFYLRKWHKEDPVDSNEIKRNTAIMNAQGNRNPFIDFPALVNRIDNF